MSPSDFKSLSHIPDPSNKRIALHVNSIAERKVRTGHPWLFGRSIQKQSHDGRPGDIAILFDRKDRFLAAGLYDPDSPIRVRILQQGQPSKINRQWFRDKLEGANRLRQPLLKDETTGYRLVHGENDGLPGLIIDRYHQTYVIMLYTAAWILHLNDVLHALSEIVTYDRIVLRLSRVVARQQQHLFGLTNGTILIGETLAGPVFFLENGLRFEVDVQKGQKTGFFLDQRENRARVGQLAGGKSVLNVFAYTGGFSLYAARGGATEVTSLDISQKALAAAKRNFKLNQNNQAIVNTDHELLVGDAFLLLKKLGDDHRLFDLVIIDPPSFAKQQSEIKRALGSYQRLVGLGLDVLNHGGMLVMASCSSRINADMFFKMIHQEAMKAGRPLREIERNAHPLDHPIGFSEGSYLKCLFAHAP